MTQGNVALLPRLLGALSARHVALLPLIDVHPSLAAEAGRIVPRDVLAMALHVALLAELLERAPTAQAYVSDVQRQGGKLRLDHGALRTVDLAGMGQLPRGAAAITRVLVPLGFMQTAEIPLPRLRMTGWAYTHADLPEAVPQFFVSELHVGMFPADFGAAVGRITASSNDPLGPGDLASLDRLWEDHALPFDEAVALLPRLVGCFDRQHDTPSLADYQRVLARSREMAWLATEGNVFNHAAERVDSVVAKSAVQRALMRPVKEAIEISASGRIKQTAFFADPIERRFVDHDGRLVVRKVPGSFFEFIERSPLPGSRKLDLGFDSTNAQGIFKMTGTRAA